MVRPADTEQLHPDLASAVADWIIVIMAERKGKGIDVYQSNGQKLDNSWVLDDLITELHNVCPDVVGRMLQAGAAAYIKETEPCGVCSGTGLGVDTRKGHNICVDCKGKGRQLVV